MLNVIPRFINESLSSCPDIRSGTFTGAVLFVDIVGFTTITEKLMVKGKSGAEELSILINKIYTPLINIVYENQGYITNFAGDALIAVFPIEKGAYYLNAALEIKDNFEKRERYYRKLSDTVISVRIGLSYGEVAWAIYGQQRKAYSFFGKTFLDSANSLVKIKPGEVALTESVLAHLKNSNDAIVISNLQKRPALFRRIKLLHAKKFVPETILKIGYSGEFRNVVPMFIAINVSEIMERAGDVIDSVLDLAVKYGGYSSSVFNSEKEPHLLVVFGAPISYENNAERAIAFSFNLISNFASDVKIGLTTGTVFAGSVGNKKRCTYTVLGDVVNQSARIMQIAEWGQVYVNSSIVSSVSEKYKFDLIGTRALKGKKDKVRLYSVKSFKFSQRLHYEGKMIGRTYQIKQLVQFCRPIQEGKFAGITYIHGEAGVGKSRLIAEFIKGLPNSVRTVILHTEEILQKSFNPFVFFLKHFFKHTETASKESNRIFFEAEWISLFKKLKSNSNSEKHIKVLEELNRTKSLLLSLLGHDTTDTLHETLDSKGKYKNTLFALKEFIKAQSLIAPTIVFIEDIHWLDEDSKALMKYLIQNVEEFPLFIVLLSRFNDDGSKVKLQLDSGTPIREITLKPLSTRGEYKLISQRLGGNVDKGLSKFIIRRTRGNPFYIEQFCCYLLENDLLSSKAGSYQLLTNELEIPLGIKSIIISRIDRLSLELKNLVQTASVLGRELNLRVLSLMLKNESSKLYPLLAEGEDEAIWSVLSEIRLIFKHALLRDVIYGMQLQQTLKSLHELAAKAMVSLYSEDKMYFTDIAYHFRLSGLKGKALEYLTIAADFARDEYRNQEALSLYEQLVALTDIVEDKLKAELEMSSIFISLGDWDKGENILEKVKRASSSAKLSAIQAKASLNTAKLYHRRGMNKEATALTNEALSYYEQINDFQGIASGYNLLGNINTILGNQNDALSCFSKSSKAAELINDLRTITMNLSNIGNIYLYQYDYTKAMEYYDLALVKSEEINDKITTANTFANMAVVCYYRLQYDKCKALFNRYIAIAEEIGNKEGLAYILGNIGVLHQELKDFDLAMTFYKRQLNLGEELGDQYNISTANRQIAQLHSMKGEFAEALDCLSITKDIAQKAEDKRNYCMALENIAMVYFRMGHFNMALENYLAAIKIADGISEKLVASYSRFYSAKIFIRQNKFVQAEKFLKKGLVIKRELEDLPSLMKALIEAVYMYVSMENYIAATDIIKEANELFDNNEIDYDKSELEFVTVLVCSKEDSESAIEKLRALNSSVTNKTLLAGVSHELYKLTKSRESQQKAISLYEELYNDEPIFEFKEALEQLGMTE